jgi:hypothetical protein
MAEAVASAGGLAMAASTPFTPGQVSPKSPLDPSPARHCCFVRISWSSEAIGAGLEWLLPGILGGRVSCAGRVL